MKNKIIIIEGATGSGKSSVSNILREQMLSTNLLRLSGIKDKTKTGEFKSFSYHKSVLMMMLDCEDCDVNWILERSYLSDKIYCNMGLKEYDFDTQSHVLKTILSMLTEAYDVHLFLLVADKETYKTRLLRDKAAYEEFSVESAIRQQKEYLDEVDKLNSIVSTHIIDTSYISEKEVANLIIHETTN